MTTLDPIPAPTIAQDPDAAGGPSNAPFWPIQTTRLPDFLKTAYRLTEADFDILIDQAIVLLEQLYVHLPAKRAARGIDPVQRLRVLRHRVPKPLQRQFHDELLSIFGSLRDQHTHFDLPGPFAGRSALMPFVVEEYVEGTGDARVRKFVVSKVVASFQDQTFKPGVIVTHWSGIPIDRAVELNGARQMAANPEAERAKGLVTLTIRPLTRTAPPDEMWVDVDYIAEDGSPRERRFEWVVGSSPPEPFKLIADAAEDGAGAAVGVDYDLEIVNQWRKLLYASSAAEPTEEAAVALAPTGAFKSYPVPTADGPYRYVRIWSFSVDRMDDFIAEFKSIISPLPQNGLIIDVRGNGGGKVFLAEYILQLLTPGEIEPERFQARTTPLVHRATRFSPTLVPFAESIGDAVVNGAVYSASLQVNSPQRVNDVGQIYHGPVVLITDALCYSATDTFAAGFQDNGVGKILGVHGTTGAGGAIVWKYSDVLQFLAGPGVNVSALPIGSTFRVSVARNLRVKKRAGVLVEELGVTADFNHDMTRNDVLNTEHPNEDLIKHAISLLKQAPTHSLTATTKRTEDGDVAVEATWLNIDRIDAFVDKRPGTSLSVTTSPTEFTLPRVSAGKHQITLNGYVGTELVAATRVETP